MQSTRWAVAWVLGTWVVTAPAWAVAPDVQNRALDTEFFSVDVGQKVATFDKRYIVSDPPIIRASFYQMDHSPHVAVPPGVEAYLLEPETRNNDYRGYRIIGRKPRGQAVTLNFFALRRHPDQPRESCLAKFEFQVDAETKTQPPRADFFRAKGLHFQRLWSEEYAGSAMFRHLAINSLKEVGQTARSTGPNWPMRRNTGVDSTIALMSGGRAVSENLQLDNQLALPSADSPELLPLSSVTGITVREINWDRFLKKEPVQLDPLAQLVPHDQYAVYLPSFEALAEIVRRGSEVAKPAVQWFEPQSRRTDVISLYQTQLALPLNALTEQIGKALIGEVAITGSDPYFRTGTDVAVLMHSKQPELLHQSILAQVTTQTALHRNVRKVQHQVDGHSFTQWSTQNRSLSTFVGRVGNHVIVANSLHQMLKVLKCADGRSKSMHGLDEYRFFRQRYPRGGDETALVVVTDAAIRRWCGPKWRIGASRRTRARATIAEITMQHADDLVRKTLTGTMQLHSAGRMPNAGSMLVTADGAYSETYGTLDFQTPIAELEITHASKEEVKLYEDWRTRYERRWRRAFDPIALKLSLTDKSIHADLSVIPLMIRTDYRQLMQFIGNVRLRPDAGDPHEESLADFTIAIDTKSSMLQLLRMMITQGANNNIDLLSWIDDSASLYFDYDQQWVKALDKRNPWEMSSDDLIREIPIGFFVPSKNNLRMTAFVVAVRATLERFSPNVIEWESIKYSDHEYVRGTVVQGTPIGNAEDMPRLYYVTTPEGLTVSFNHKVVQRAIDRHLVNKKSKPEGEPQLPTDDAENAPQLRMHASGKGVALMARTNYRNGLRRMNRIAWSNIPILNYFRSRYPDLDPASVYQQLFGQQLVEPSGGKYVWDDAMGTYVSTHQGFHLQPKAGPAVGPVLQPGDQVRTAISFQDGGLRAILKVEEQ